VLNRKTTMTREPPGSTPLFLMRTHDDAGFKVMYY
jgi:hypothetical protein